METADRTARAQTKHALQSVGERGAGEIRAGRFGNRRTADVQGETRPASQQTVAAHDGRSRQAPRSRQGGTLVLYGHAQRRSVRTEGGTLLYDRRKIE